MSRKRRSGGVARRALGWQLAAVLGVLVGGPARCEDLRHWWLGASGGIGEVEVIGHDRSALVTEVLQQSGWDVVDVSAGEDDATRVWTLRGGYRFNRYLGLELAYWDLGTTAGDFRATAAAPQAGAALAGEIDSRYRSWAACALASWPLHRWVTITGKVGAHRWEHVFALRGDGGDAAIAADHREAGFGALWALGVELGVLRGLFFDFYWQRFYNIEGEDGIDAKVVGLGWRF